MNPLKAILFSIAAQTNKSILLIYDAAVSHNILSFIRS